MGNKNSHNFTTTRSRSLSFDTPLSRPWGKKTDTSAKSRPYALAARSPDLSSRSYNSKSLDNSHRARSLGSLNTPGISYSTSVARPSPATSSSISRQSSSQTNVPSRPASATLTRQTSSQPVMSRQTSSQLSTPRQYSDVYLTDDLKKLYKSHDKSKAQALVDDIDPDDTSAHTLDRKLNALKNQRQQENPSESKSTNGTIPRKSKKTKAPPAPQLTASTLPRNTTKTAAPVPNGKVKAKKKSAPVPPSHKYEYVEPLPVSPPLPPTTAPPAIEESPSHKSNDNNNNNSGGTSQKEPEVPLHTDIQLEIQKSPTPAVDHPLISATSQPSQPNARLQAKITASKRRSKPAPLPPSSHATPKVSSSFELELDSADDFIKAISPKSEQKEVSIQCDIPLDPSSRGTKEHGSPAKSEKNKNEGKDEPGEILKLYIDKNAVNDSQRPPDESSPVTEHEPDEPQKRKQKVIELDDILVQTDEMSKPVLLSHKDLKAIAMENIDTNSITTEESDTHENRPYDEDLLTPRPEVGFSEERFLDPPIMQSSDVVSTTTGTVDDKAEKAKNIKAESIEEAPENAEAKGKDMEAPLDIPDHSLKPNETSKVEANQEMEVTIPQHEVSMISTSATVSPNSNNSELNSPSQPSESSEKAQKKKKRRSLSKLGKSMKSFVSTLGRSSNKASKITSEDKHSDVEEPEPELELANDNWVFSPKGGVKSASRPEYNPTWVDETFKSPEPEPSPRDIEVQIDKLMVGAVDLSDHEDPDDQSKQTADVVIENTTTVLTVPDTIQTNINESDDGAEISIAAEAEIPISSDNKTEPTEKTTEVNKTDTSSSNSNFQHNTENPMQDLSEDEKPVQAPVLTNGDLPHKVEDELANGWVSPLEDTKNTNDITAAPETTQQQTDTAQDMHDVIYRAKPATVVHRAEPTVITDDTAKPVEERTSKEKTAPATPPKPTVQKRSSLVFMTPKGYGATSSKYRPIDKTQLSSTGSAS